MPAAGVWRGSGCVAWPCDGERGVPLDGVVSGVCGRGIPDDGVNTGVAGRDEGRSVPRAIGCDDCERGTKPVPRTVPPCELSTVGIGPLARPDGSGRPDEPRSLIS